jgi:hypothetical protein
VSGQPDLRKLPRRRRRHLARGNVAIGVTRGPFLASPLGANFDPTGEVVPQG